MLKFINYDIVFQEIPDEVTLAINLSNCPNHCKGCHSPYLWEDKGIELTEDVLSDLLRQYGAAITCVCFMGGDAAPNHVERLATFLNRQQIAKVKTAWYSGKSLLSESISLQSFQYIKLGPYLAQFGGLKSPDTNQHLYKIENQQMKDITSMFWKKSLL